MKRHATILSCLVFLIIEFSQQALIADNFTTPLTEQGQQQSAATEYFIHFDALRKQEKWDDIVTLGEKAVVELAASNNLFGEGKVHAQLASSYFYLGDYAKALEHSVKGNEVASSAKETALSLRCLYLESACHRALAGKASFEQQPALFNLAVAKAEKALRIFQEEHIQNEYLKAKILFNLGAAESDNVKGNLEKAKICYEEALALFSKLGCGEDASRTALRLGKVELLYKEFDKVQKIITNVRPKITSKRVMFQLEYLDAQLQLALGKKEEALHLAKLAREKAEKLGAKEDIARLDRFINEIAETLS